MIGGWGWDEIHSIFIPLYIDNSKCKSCKKKKKEKKRKKRENIVEMCI